MKQRVLYQLFFTVALALIVSTSVYYLICKGLRQVKRDAVGKFNFLVNDTTHYNTVFLGSSTLHVGIDPLQFNSITGLNSFNAGLDGMAITEVNMLVKKYMKSH